MLISGETFTGPELEATLPQDFGHHDTTWVRRDTDGLVVPETMAGETLNIFLRGVNSMLDKLREAPDSDLATIGVKPEELDEYTYGTAFYNYVPAGNLSGGEFHYDSGFDRPIVASNLGAAVLRFVGNWTTDGTNVSYIFSSNPEHYDKSVGEVVNEGSPDIIQPDNNHVILFNEGAGLHGTAPASERPGQRTVIFSTTLCREPQVPKTKFKHFELPPLDEVRRKPLQ
jgi:hypothetical protein